MSYDNKKDLNHFDDLIQEVDRLWENFIINEERLKKRVSAIRIKVRENESINDETVKY